MPFCSRPHFPSGYRGHHWLEFETTFSHGTAADTNRSGGVGPFRLPCFEVPQGVTNMGALVNLDSEMNAGINKYSTQTTYLN